MSPIDSLMKEHRLIEKVLEALEAWTGAVLAREQTDDKAELGRFVTFIREFADACHHGKEEDILFATLIEHGFPRQQGPIAVMFAEHQQGRALVARLDALATQEQPWSDEDRRALAEATRGYIALLRQHILKEDRILYPMAQARLPGDTMDRVADRFRRFEEEETGSGEHERLHQLAHTLVESHLS
jgi:hemerythrin-like domain-containing protein